MGGLPIEHLNYQILPTFSLNFLIIFFSSQYGKFIELMQLLSFNFVLEMRSSSLLYVDSVASKNRFFAIIIQQKYTCVHLVLYN